MFCERHYTAPVKGDGQFFSLGPASHVTQKGFFTGMGAGRFSLKQFRKPNSII